MSSLDADVNIRINAEDNASQPIDNSVKNIDRSFVQMRNGMRANERSFYLQHQSIFKLNQVMGTLRSVTGAGIQVMNTLLLSQIRNQTAAKNMRDAIRDENDAFLEFGAGSREFNDAHERTTQLIEDQKNQLIQDILQWTTLGTYLASTIIPNLTKIKGLIGGGGLKTTPGGIPASSATPSKTMGGVQGPNRPTRVPGGGVPGSNAGVSLGYAMIPGSIDWAAQQFGIDKNPLGGAPSYGNTPSGNTGQQWAQIIVNINGMTESDSVYSE